MTDEERAISILSELEHNYIGYDNLHGDNEQGCRIIEESLNLRVAKPIKRYPSHPEIIFMCPTCGSTFVRRNGILMRFCNNCGQFLKESENGTNKETEV